MAMRHRRTIGLAWWTAGLLLASTGVVMASSCAKGSLLDDSSAGVGGAGGSASGDGPASSSSHGSTSSSAKSSSSASGPSGPSSSSGPSGSSGSAGGGAAIASSSVVGSSSSGMMCNLQEHLCNGMCVGNTIDTGCYLSATCVPCPMPSNGVAICSPNGTCGVQCNMGYVPNAGNTDCVPPPMLMQCCDDNACPIFTICLDGYCKSPFDVCDAARCNDFCKCTTGGTPQSTGMCVQSGPFWMCQCMP